MLQRLEPVQARPWRTQSRCLRGVPPGFCPESRLRVLGHVHILTRSALASLFHLSSNAFLQRIIGSPGLSSQRWSSSQNLGSTPSAKIQDERHPALLTAAQGPMGGPSGGPIEPSYLTSSTRRSCRSSWVKPRAKTSCAPRFRCDDMAGCVECQKVQRLTPSRALFCSMRACLHPLENQASCCKSRSGRRRKHPSALAKSDGAGSLPLTPLSRNLLLPVARYSA